MKRWRCKFPLPMLFILLASGIAMPAASPAQEGVFATPEAARENPDFGVQGEYASASQGMQVVALGDGEFELVVYPGGLPGAGWTGEEPRRVDGDADVVDSIVDSQGMERIERQSDTLGANPPSGAVVLFDGTEASLGNWEQGARITDDGLLMQGATSKRKFGDYTLHLEFRTPFQPAARGQQRGNSGLYHQGRYENQILDSFGLSGENNEAGGIYAIRKPDLNACFPPLTWQTYDVQFTAARYDDAGEKIEDARVTVRLNGIIIHNNQPVPDSTRAAPWKEGPEDGPIYLQDHGNPVRFRNIWVLPRDAAKEARRPLHPSYERFYAATAMSESNPLELANGGQLLAESLGCLNCHGGRERIWEAAVGPVLNGVASRVRPDHLMQWIQDPRGVKQGTTMPGVLGSLSPEEQGQAAKAIASFLLLGEEDQVLVDSAGSPTAARRGETLYHTVGCVACHAPQDGRVTPDSTNIPLGPLAEKYTLESLTQFLENPHASRPDGRMPRLVADLAEARQIATYLLRDVVLVPGAGQWKRKLYRGSWENLPDFSELEPVENDEVVGGIGFEGINPKDGFGLVFNAFLPIQNAGKYTFTVGSDDGSRVVVDGTEVARVDGTHPYQTNSGSIELTPGMHDIQLEFFEAGGGEELTLDFSGPGFNKTPVTEFVTLDPENKQRESLVPNTFVPDPNLFDQGRKWFSAVGCANCHDFEPQGARVEPVLEAGPWHRLDSQKGCLAADPPAAVPHYELTSAQRLSLSAAIASARTQRSRGELIDLTLKAANCYACHSRDGIGGPELARVAFFETTTKEMGNEGSVPPPLTGVGDKLTNEYFSKVLNDGANERPYMKTRMPAFGYDRMKLLHQRLIKQDRVVDNSPQLPEDTLHQLVADGRQLVGNEGLACIKCHTYGGEGTPGIQAIDMLVMPKRLRRDWFVRYLLDPQKYRPGTRMPASFPDGKSVLTTIADGDPTYQILAMWDYLKEGDPKRIPSGLRPGAIELKPQDRPILYRSFLDGLSSRGIAVGNPEGIHFAWDASSMALRFGWQNQFLDVSPQWRGRGPGTIGPLGDAVVEIEKTAPVALLDARDADWPSETTKSRGYRFLGYELNAKGQPKFNYQLDGVRITESPLPKIDSDQQRSLVRTITVTPSSEVDASKEIVLQLASGSLEQLGPLRYRVNDAFEIELRGVEADAIFLKNGTQLRAVLPIEKESALQVEYRW